MNEHDDMQRQDDGPLPRWLLVDDDRVFTDTIARGLRRHGFACVAAHDGETALALAAREQPDRVLLDLRLGVESGLVLLPQLRALLPDAEIVVLTGFASIATAVRAVKDGADDYLPKPALLRDLLARFEALSARAGNDDGDDVEDVQATAIDTRAMSPRRLEWEHIQRVLGECDGNISEAARRLGMHRRSLQRKLAKRPSAR
jgi:two-component system response regulator RegA